ncbi:MAG: hypothetical protein KGQ37_09435 [Hyphomicrobiales bacterium]|nr:hypothetical protein [Hyphomicrobiales bacterium]
MSAFLDDAADLGPGASGVPVEAVAQSGMSTWAHLGQVFSSAEQAAETNSLTNSSTLAAQEAYHQRNAAIQAATGVQLGNPAGRAPLTGMEDDPDNATPADPIDQRALQLYAAQTPGYHMYQRPSLHDRIAIDGLRRQAWQEAAQRLARQYPDQAGVIQADQLPDGAAVGRAQSAQAEAVYGQGGILPWLASTAGGIWAGRRDPVQVGSMAWGGFEGLGAKIIGSLGDNLFGRMVARGVTGAVSNVAMTGAMEPMEQDWKRATGQPTGVSAWLKDAGSAAEFGFAGGALDADVAHVLYPLKPMLVEAMSGSRRAAAKLTAALPAAAPDTNSTLDADAHDNSPEPLPQGVNPAAAQQSWRDAVAHGEGEALAPLAEPAPVTAPGVTDAKAAAVMAAHASDPYAGVMALHGDPEAVQSALASDQPDLFAAGQLASLSDDALARVGQGDVPPEYARHVAALVPDSGDHGFYMDELAAARPANEDLARMVVSDELQRQTYPASMLALRGGLPGAGLPRELPVIEARDTVAQRAAQTAALEQSASAITPIPAMAAVSAFPESAATPSGRTYMFDAASLLTDARKMQFKDNGDAEGVTGALKAVRKWDPAKGNAIMVWQARDGRLYVADGHQRTGLARRLVAEGHPPIQIPGMLYREEDGFSAEMTRAIAAAKNIAEGSGSPIDGAKVLRDHPELMDGSMPTSRTEARYAFDLAKLGEEPFRMVVNDVVPYQYGALAGRMIADPELQQAAIRALAAMHPANETEAALVVRNVMDSELRKADAGAQGSMFGDMIDKDSTAVEEMRIAAASIKTLARDKSLFQRVMANADRLEQEGSSIGRDQATRVQDDAARLTMVVEKMAFRAGPVRDALKALAGELKDGKIAKEDAVRSFLGAIRDGAEEDMGRGPESPAPAGAAATADQGGQAGELSAAAGDDAQASQGGQAPLNYEPGAEGLPQALLPGVDPVSMRQKLEAAAQKPLRGGERAPGGLFDDNERNQSDMFDAPPSDRVLDMVPDSLREDGSDYEARARSDLLASEPSQGLLARVLERCPV